MLRIRDILQEIECHAPLWLQESFDNSGIQVGDIDRPALGALLCLDVTEAVIDEALERGCNLIISHHPLAFKPFKSLTGANYVQRCIMKACKNDLVVYAAHTNLDNAANGVSFKLAEYLGLQNVRILSQQQGALLKLATFVPEAQAEAVRAVLFEAGAGHIGAYDACSFNIRGEGSFRASEGCRPFVGSVGTLHREPEIRIETILPKHLKSTVLRALLAAHPYEEPAFDFYPLENEWSQAGSGVVGTLPEESDERMLLQRIKETLHLDSVRHSCLTGKKIRKVALCGGSGAFLIPEAIAAGADLFITGEAKYNDFFDVEDRILLAVIGHYESEICTKHIFHDIISKKFPTFAVQFSTINSNPVNYI